MNKFDWILIDSFGSILLELKRRIHGWSQFNVSGEVKCLTSFIWMSCSVNHIKLKDEKLFFGSFWLNLIWYFMCVSKLWKLTDSQAQMDLDDVWIYVYSVCMHLE